MEKFSLDSSIEKNWLDELNQVAQVKPYRNFDFLKENVEYPVKKLKRTETRYGRKILMESEEFQIFLPDRIDGALDEQQLEEFNARILVSPTYMIYLGKQGWFNSIKFTVKQHVDSSILSELNEAARYKPLLNFDEIKETKQYTVKSLLRIHETEYGPAILMESLDFRIYLPKRLLNLTDEQLDQVNALAKKEALYIVYLGKCGNERIIRFENEGDTESYWGRYLCVLNAQIAYEDKQTFAN